MLLRQSRAEVEPDLMSSGVGLVLASRLGWEWERAGRASCGPRSLDWEYGHFPSDTDLEGLFAYKFRPKPELEPVEPLRARTRGYKNRQGGEAVARGQETPNF